MSASNSRQFFRLLTQFSAPQVFNPWVERNRDEQGNNGPEARLARLKRHLSIDPQLVLIGEASGYQGCRVTGIPFTSERLVVAGGIPRIDSDGSRLSTRERPWSEPSATVVWRTLHELAVQDRTVLWNAFAWHPYKPQQPHSNRTPTPAERERGLQLLDVYLAQFPQARVFAVGRHAEQALAGIGRGAVALRHPSMGGALKFQAELTRALQKKS